VADVLLYQTVDGGEVTCEAGQIELDDGVATATYLSLFGGNEDDSGDDADKAVEWWGNKVETDATKKLRSRVQNLLRSIAASSGNLRRIEDAANLDLAWMVETQLATVARASASIPALNWIKLDVKIEIQDKVISLAFAKKTGIAA
jgi:phage gp46-like protein